MPILPRQRTLLASAATLGLGAFAAPAVADAQTATQAVTGATISTLSISIPTPAALTGVSPGSTASGSGAIAVTSTGGWTLSVDDASTGANVGHPVAATGATCSGSEAALANPLSLSMSTLTGTATPAGSVALSGTNQTVATGTSSATLTANYSDAIRSTEQMVTGCVYGLTATYTVQ